MPHQRHRPDPNKSLVGFFVGDVHYALHIGHVREIVNPASVTALPHTPQEVLGVADHRGEVIPIIELRARFGLPPLDSSRSTKWVLVTVDGRLFGLVVDAVTDVFGTGDVPLADAPAVGGRADARGIEGVTNSRGRLSFVLDTRRFLASADEAMLSYDSVRPEARP